MSWEEARQLCQCQHGGHLASISSAEEGGRVALLTTDNSWIGDLQDDDDDDDDDLLGRRQRLPRGGQLHLDRRHGLELHQLEA